MLISGNFCKIATETAASRFLVQKARDFVNILHWWFLASVNVRMWEGLYSQSPVALSVLWKCYIACFSVLSWHNIRGHELWMLLELDELLKTLFYFVFRTFSLTINLISRTLDLRQMLAITQLAIPPFYLQMMRMSFKNPVHTYVQGNFSYVPFIKVVVMISLLIALYSP